MPAANQLWMLVGFAVFTRLRKQWDCLEVFPQAIVAELELHHIHKSRAAGLLAQFTAMSLHTRWPADGRLSNLRPGSYGSGHDQR
jgi:hypothetical protein